jgi:hypothetical protein
VANPATGVVSGAAPSLKGYTPIAPVRICDTRAVAGAPTPVLSNQCDAGGAKTLGPGGMIPVTVAGSNGVPTTATAVVLNVTATDTTAVSYLTVWPEEATQPVASNMNWGAGQTVPNLVEVALGPSGVVKVYNNLGSADVVVDLEGYVDATATGLYAPLSPPVRVCDTRVAGQGVAANQCQGAGGVAGTLTNSTPKVIAVGAGVPLGATAVILNVTVTNPSAGGFLTVWPDGSSMPLASNLNWVAGQTVPNRVIVGVAGGKVDIALGSTGTADVIVDVNGFFSTTTTSAAATGGYVAIPPVRVCDSRPVGPGVNPNECNNPDNGGGALGPGGEFTITQNPSLGIIGQVFNVTVTNTTGDSFLTVFPDPTPNAPLSIPPLVSDLNYKSDRTVANMVVVGEGPASAITFYNNLGTTDFIVDLAGYYTASATAATASLPSFKIVRGKGR